MTPQVALRGRLGGRVASAAGSDARSRDEGDASVHPAPKGRVQTRREAIAAQTALRRRNRLRWLAFSPGCDLSRNHCRHLNSSPEKSAKGRTRLRIHFSAAC
ncbi:MAG: hypothetical protein LC729_03420 [Acidobacteria bacterium]|nr:hypothetical protein [Acidobacteriota bacterium]